jgi:hypothetical protein
MEQSKAGLVEVPTFVDEGARRWEVREIREPLLPERAGVLSRPEFSSGWLLFSCETEHRRLAPLPPGWRVAPDEQLRRWCADAAPARMRS